jgi:diguanylate cyclase (GGDEF)-like protein
VTTIDPLSESARPPSEPTGLSLRSRIGVVVVSLIVVVCLGVGDALTGSDASFTLLYLAPVAFSTWFVGLATGASFSVIASIASTTADLLAREGTPLPPAIMAWNLMVQLGVYLAMALLLAGFRSRLEGEQLLARTDALTRVANRRAFIEAAELELERTRRTGRALTLAYVDADDFKDVNDRLGHAEGDRLLVVVAQTLRGSTRAVDAVARLGGDEFGLLLPETDGPTAQALLARLNATLLAAMERHGWKVGFSTGAATFATPPISVDQLMARADELMYRAKRTAKGSMCAAVFSDPPAAPSDPPAAPGSGSGLRARA